MPRIVLKAHDSEKPIEASTTEATIGRDPACLLFIDGPNSKVVSARHARIFFQDGGWWIEDTSRNGTILDEERLQAGQRHALKVGQLIGLGESGPRYRVTTLEARQVAETMVESAGSTGAAAGIAGTAAASAAPNSTTAPRQGAMAQRQPAQPPPVSADLRTAPVRKSEAMRAGLNVQESTEPMAPSPDWLVHVILRATNTNQHYEIRSHVVKLGRSPECNVQVPPEHGASVSRIHAEILVLEGGVTLRDAGSRNGTFLNGRRVDALHPVTRNDLIMLGSGGPTFSVEDLHIVKGNASPAPPAANDSGESTPKNARPLAGLAPSPGLSRHTSYRSEPPTAPAKLTGQRDGHLGRSVLEDVNPRSAKVIRTVIWIAIGVAVLAAASLFVRG